MDADYSRIAHAHLGGISFQAVPKALAQDAEVEGHT